MNTNKEPASDEDSTPTAEQRLLQLVRLCQASAEAVKTDDHASMDEIERSLAIAEIAALRLMAAENVEGLRNDADESDDVIDLDEF